MKIIPAIDIINGKCVRLSQGNYDKQTIYNENPIEVAKYFEDAGLNYLHLIDLDGAKNKKVTNIGVLEQIATKTKLIIDFGGGITTTEDIQSVFNAGANQVNIGSIAATNNFLFQNWLNEFESEKIILSADCKQQKIAIHGWQKNTEIDILNFLKINEMNGTKYTTVTDVSRDGMLAGPAIDLYIEIMKETNLKLIASGGVSSLKDLVELKKIGCYGVIIGKAIYEEKINLKDLVELC